MLKLLSLTLVFPFFLNTIAFSQSLDYERGRHKDMLRSIKQDIEKNYYDPQFRGIDLEAKYKAAAEKIGQANSIGQMSGIIAQFMIDFDDSHMFFVPPGKANKTDYGFEMQMIGDKCFVTSIDEKSDAYSKGIRVGDEIYSIDGFGPSRDNMWKIRYFYYSLRPRSGVKLDINKPNGTNSVIDVMSKITQGKRVMDATSRDLNELIRRSEDAERKATRQYIYDKMEGLFIWKIPGFSIDPSKVDDIMGKAKKAPSMIIDLRGNGGGRVDMVLRLIGHFVTEDIKIADEKTRKKTKEVIAKTRGKDAFSGKLVVLIDGDSGSASEVFSRVIQIENRGTVLGDQSAGAVMESMFFDHQVGIDVVAFYGASITIADLIMKDGKSLEKIGVTPNEKILPTPSDLAAGRDPVLSRAADILGFKMSPEEAGALLAETRKYDAP